MDERRKEMTHVYAPCSLCGGEVVPEHIRHTYHWNGRLFIFEDVPAGVCVQCSEVYFTAETVKTMEKTVLSKIRPKRTIRVPVYTYADAEVA
jgi:YgiT-type zinc finger domain-containing protein